MTQNQITPEEVLNDISRRTWSNVRAYKEGLEGEGDGAL